MGHILENVIYLELKRRGYEVYVGKMDELEVDFVVKEPKKTTYIQVAASVRNSDTLERELTPLQRDSGSLSKVDFDTGRRPGGGLRGHSPHQCTGLADGDGKMTGEGVCRAGFSEEILSAA